MNFKKSISDTTRQKREGDINGRDYYFLSEKEFKDKIEKEEYVEYATVSTNFLLFPVLREAAKLL